MFFARISVKKECSTKLQGERERPDKSCKSNFPQAETPAVASLGNELLGRFRQGNLDSDSVLDEYISGPAGFLLAVPTISCAPLLC